MAELYVIIAGAGKVGWNLARELLEKGHEVTAIEQDRRRYEVPRVIARVLDPRRAAWYAEQGLQTVCPTAIAIEQLEAAALGDAASDEAA